MQVLTVKRAADRAGVSEGSLDPLGCLAANQGVKLFGQAFGQPLSGGNSFDVSPYFPTWKTGRITPPSVGHRKAACSAHSWPMSTSLSWTRTWSVTRPSHARR